MDKSGPGKSDTFIVRSEKVWWRELVVIVFTVLVWVYCLTVVCFFVDAVSGSNHEYARLFKIAFKMNNVEIISFIEIGVGLFAAIYSLLWIWMQYNRRRYGGLTRRKYPALTTQEDLMRLHMIDENVYAELQQAKVVVIETNPIRNGEDLGAVR